jgi:hypothetical protein
MASATWRADEEVEGDNHGCEGRPIRFYFSFLKPRSVAIATIME